MIIGPIIFCRKKKCFGFSCVVATMSPQEFREARSKAQQQQQQQHPEGDQDPAASEIHWVNGYPYLPLTVVTLSHDDLVVANAAASSSSSSPPTTKSPATILGRVVTLLFQHHHALHQQYLDQLVVEPVVGGTTNTLFKVSGLHAALLWGNKETETHRNEHHDNTTTSSSAIVPNVVLIRLFGAAGLIDRDVETSTYMALAQAGLAPPYYGAFGNGRVEGWMDGMRPLQTVELGQPEMARGIAAAMAQLHYGMDVPPHLVELSSSSDEPTQSSSAVLQPVLWTQLSEWHEQAVTAVREFKFPTSYDQQRANQLNVLSSSTSIPDELTWLQSIIDPTDSDGNSSTATIRLCHNDVLASNILYQDDTQQIQLIDFEYGGCNYPSFDIANHWNEYANGPPTTAVPNYDWFPTPAQQECFVQSYLDTVHTLVVDRGGSNRSNDDSKDNDTPPPIPTLPELLEEIRVFCLVNHLYWGLWAVNQAATEGCTDYDYLLYAQSRFHQYWISKAQYQTQQQPSQEPQPETISSTE